MLAACYMNLLQLFQGDQILELNGQSTKSLALYDVNQIVQRASEDLLLTVVENKASEWEWSAIVLLLIINLHVIIL